MINYQVRHFQSDEDSLIFDYESNLNVLNAVLGNIEYAPGVSSLKNYAMDVAVNGVLLNKIKTEMLENFRRFAEMGVFTFKMNAADSATFTAMVLGKEFELPADRDGSYITATDWLSYLQCATIAGDQQSIDYLLSIPSKVFEMTSASFNAFDQSLVECYKEIYQNHENEEAVLKRIKTVMENANHPYLNNYLLPTLNVYQSFYSAKGEDISETIADALTKHVNYWNTEDNKFDSRGWISIPLISALIHKNYHTEVKSAYLPENIIP